jgi:hypothetical protein
MGLLFLIEIIFIFNDLLVYKFVLFLFYNLNHLK